MTEPLDPYEFRGGSTNRALTEGYAPGEGSILKILNLSLADLAGNKTLDVAVGRGNALKEALERGYDYYAVDIVPVIPQVNAITQRAYSYLQEINKQYPGRIIGADAAAALPFADSTFDLVMSCIGLPEYARNTEEAVNSILEMIRVSKGKVAFDAGLKGDEIVRTKHLRFPLNKFLLFLKPYGIGYEIKECTHPQLIRTQSVHLDVSQKDAQKLTSDRQKIIDAFAKPLKE